MRLSDGHVHRLIALLGSLTLCSCSPPPTTPAPFHTSATVRFTGSSIVTTEANGDVTVVGNADHLHAGDARTVTVIGNGVHVSGACPTTVITQIGNANAGHLTGR